MRTLVLFLAACLFLGGCGAEGPARTAEETANGALPLCGLLCACPSFASFDGAPGEALAREAVWAYPDALASAGEAEDAAGVYGQLFAFGAYAEPEARGDAPVFTPARVFLESALDGGAGEVIASVRAEYDFGFGWEFGCYFDVYLVPDERARFGARVARVFIPE